MSKLIKKVQEREEQISSLTKEIIDKYKDTILDTIENYYDISTDGMEFDAIKQYPNKDSKYLMIDVYKVPKPGDIIRTSEHSEPIVIDANNQNKYRTAIRFVADSEILEGGNDYEISISIRNLLDLAITLEPEDFEKLLTDRNFSSLSQSDVNNATLENLNINLNRFEYNDDDFIEEIGGFDVSGLSEEQKMFVEIQLIDADKKVH